MKPGLEYEAVESSPPMSGLATAFPSTKIDPKYSPNLLNCYVRDGVVRRRAGGTQLGRRLMGKVLGITEFQQLGGAAYTLALTSKRQYGYDPATKDWVDLTPGQVSYTITVADIVTKKFTIAGDHVAALPVDLVFPIVGGANQGIYTVASATLVTGTTRIVVDETPLSNVAGGAIVLADEFDTQNTGYLSFIGITDLNGKRFLVTNGHDTPRKWDGNLSNPFTDWTPTYTNFVTCKTFAVFFEHMFMGGVVTATDEPQIIAWSKAGDFDEFEDIDSGVQLLYQLTSPIKALLNLGDRLAIYSDNEIMNASFVGLPAVFAFELVIPGGTTLIGPKAIAQINIGHILATNENFYLYDGTRGLRTLSDAMYNDYKEHKDQSIIDRTCLLYDPPKRTVFFSIPDVEDGGTLVYTMFFDIFALSNLVWSKEKYHDTVSCFGFFINRDQTLLWEDASWETANMPWNDELGAWDQESERINFPIRSYGTEDGRVVIVTEGQLSDRGYVPTQIYETKDFEVPETLESTLGRWGEIEIDAWGTQVNVQVSMDKGQNYVGIDTLVLTESPTMYRLPMDHMGRTCRVRLLATSDFAVRLIRLWVRSGGPA